MSCEPNTLLSESGCLAQSIPPGIQDQVQTYLLSLVNGGETDPSALMAAAKDFASKVPPGMQQSLHIHLLCQILSGLVVGTDCSPQALAAAARCYKCIPRGWQKAVQTNLLCQWSEGGSGLCNHPIVIDWLTRLAADFIQRPTDDIIRAVCDFCNALDAAGITDKMLVVNPIIYDATNPTPLLLMQYPLIYEAGNSNSPWLNHNFVNADLNIDGLIGDGLTTYMETGFAPGSSPDLADDRGGLSIYESEASLLGGIVELEIGISNALGGVFLGCYEPTGLDGIFECWDGPTQTLMGTGADVPAFYCMSRTSVTNLACYRNATPVPNSPNVWNDTGAPVAADPIYFMAYNDVVAALPAGWTNKRVSFASVQTNLSAGEEGEFYDIVQTLRMQLGGGYV